MNYRSHTREDINIAIRLGLEVWTLDTGTDGEDDTLIGDKDLVILHVCDYHEIDELPSHWSLEKFIETDDYPTIAEHVSSLFGDNGQNFETSDGREFVDVAAKYKADVTYSNRDYSYGYLETTYTLFDGVFSAHIAGDPIRFEFPDKSAIVVCGDCWDIEGSTRFNMQG